MIWLGLIIGLFVGVNIGIVVAGMLFSAKAGDKALHPTKRKDPASLASGMSNENFQGSSRPTLDSAQLSKNFTDNTVA